ncbi:CDP-glycerol glycerophosphotransferase family protein [Micromonospora sp. LOL_024]|uniref:CDP-glycerol glycerophosphotransferase family protein n=1 Tax=Micromonospora sp. LOL_024 TaxID=3345412 RepID=UPI003A862CB0
MGTLTLRVGVAARGALLVSTYLLLLAAGALGWVAVFAVAGLAAVLGEFAAQRWSPATATLMDKAGLGLGYRQLARDVSVVLLVVAEVPVAGGALTLLLLLPATVWLIAVFAGAFRRIIDRRDGGVLVRNVDLGRPPAPGLPSWTGGLSGDRLPWVNVPLVPAAVVAAVAGEVVPVQLAGAVALALAAVVGGTVALTWLRGRGRGTRLSAAQRWLTSYRPEVALYFAGPAKDAYQANMWLTPTEALDRPAVVFLRNPEALPALADLRLPVVCVPSGADFMNLDKSSIRAALYPANAGENIHLLREPGMKHVFLGHGDSDKAASVNPFCRVYDEVWVAGPAGRERHARAGVGVRDCDVVEIGRPQLAGVHAAGTESVDRPFTVLYAPTWEGWLADDPYHTSVVLMGDRIVAGLLAIRPAVRLVYKPHPLTGSQSGRARAAHDRIVQRIRSAGGDVDATELDGTAHRVVTGAGPALFDCFNQSDLLVSDVSSVVSDFVQSQRPYVVTNPAGLPDDEFRRAFPTSRAGYLLDGDCGEVEKIVAVTRAGNDPMTEARRELRTYLLGPAEANPLGRFVEEVGRLCRR